MLVADNFFKKGNLDTSLHTDTTSNTRLSTFTLFFKKDLEISSAHFFLFKSSLLTLGT